MVLAAAVFLVFGRTLVYPCVNYDDPSYASDAPEVTRGLTGQGIVWAFTTRHASNWHPLTWLSLMLDCQVCGTAPWGHHLGNVLLHAANAILLFLVMRRMTGDFWPSAFVAAAFAVHPLRVESVAWIAERKDVLSGLFFMLTVGAYVGYARAPFSLVRYSAVAAVLALGLISKPMLVTLPFVLLLLDYWPLERFTIEPRPADASASGATGAGGFWRQALTLVVEKLPLMALSAAACIATVWAQQEAIESLKYHSIATRIANAAVAYVAYLGQTLWPGNLTVIYPHPGSALADWKIAAAAVVLAAVSATVFILRRRRYLAVGWLWYLGMLLPVIGLVQVGLQAMADRYTYLPQIGLLIAVAWSVAELGRARRWSAGTYGVVAASVLAIMTVCACRQVSYWRDSVALWTHALECTANNTIAHCNLGLALVDRGELVKGIEQYEKALAIEPEAALPRNNLGEALKRLGRLDEAIREFRITLKITPNSADVQYNLGEALRQAGQLAEAVEHLRRSIELKPGRADAHANLGAALAQQGKMAEAVEQFYAALKIDPNCVEAHNNLGVALARQQKFDEAIRHYAAAIKVRPDYAKAHNNLGAALDAQGRLGEAIEEYREAVRLDPDYALARHNLEEALQKAGR